MASLRQYDRYALQDEQMAFWQSGNAPSQAILGLSERDVVAHLKALYLLFDRVLAAASFYFESPATRAATRQCRPLFEQGKILYFVGDGVGDFEEHGERKIQKSPLALQCYSNVRRVVRHARDLDGLGSIFKRPPDSISDKMVELWTADVVGSHPGSIGAYLAASISNAEERAALQARLVDIAGRRDADFVWEYLEPKLLDLGLRGETIRRMRSKLADLYISATVAILTPGAAQPLDDQACPHTRAWDEPNRFLVCLDGLGLRGAFQRLAPEEVMTLKESWQCRMFLDFYRAFVRDVRTPPQLLHWLALYKKAEGQFATADGSREHILKAFLEYVRSIEPRPKHRLGPLEILLKAFEFCRQPLISAFVDEMRRLSSLPQRSDELPVKEARRIVPTIVVRPSDRIAFAIGLLEMGHALDDVAETLRMGKKGLYKLLKKSVKLRTVAENKGQYKPRNAKDGRIPRGTKDRETGQVEAADYRDPPPDEELDD